MDNLDDKLKVTVTFKPSHTERREMKHGNIVDTTVPHEISLTINEPTYIIDYYINIMYYL